MASGQSWLSDSGVGPGSRSWSRCLERMDLGVSPPERRPNRMVADGDDVLRARLRHGPVDVEHEGLIGAVLIRLDLGRDVVQVVQGLDGRAEALRWNTPIRGRHGLQAALVALAEEIDARLRDDDDARTGLAFPRVEAAI